MHEAIFFQKKCSYFALKKQKFFKAALEEQYLEFSIES